MPVQHRSLSIGRGDALGISACAVLLGAGAHICFCFYAGLSSECCRLPDVVISSFRQEHTWFFYFCTGLSSEFADCLMLSFRPSGKSTLFQLAQTYRGEFMDVADCLMLSFRPSGKGNCIQ